MKKSIQVLGILLMATFAFTACTQHPTNSVDPGIFAGTWNGTFTCAALGSSTATVIIGMDGSTAALTGVTGVGACQKAAAYTGTLVNDHLVFSTQLATDGCGNSNSFSASVYVYQNTLTMTQSVAGPNLTTTCSFVGTH